MRASGTRAAESPGVASEAVEPPPLDEVLSRLSVGDGDPGVVGEYAMGLIAARTRRRRTIAGIAAILVLAAGATALTIGGTDDPEEIVSPASKSTTTQQVTAEMGDVTASTKPAAVAPVTTATQPPVSLPDPSLPADAAAGSATQGPTAPPAPTPTRSPAATTTPPTIGDLPPQGTLAVTSGSAGSALELSFDFWDPDGPSAKPTMIVYTDEPGSQVAVLATRHSGSCTGGPGSRGALRDQVQFASTGRRRVTVAVSYCDAAPSVYTTDVDVAPPRFGDGPGRAVTAEVPDLYQVAQEAGWEFRPDTGESVTVQPGAPDITHRLEPENGFSLLGVVVVVPADEAGELVLVVPGAANTSPGIFSGRLEAASAPDGSATHVRMVAKNPKGTDLP